MANVFDVAVYILRKQGPMSAMKLQKLVYYSQAWSLVWDGKPLFREKIEAWANGPVVRSLFKAHQGMFEVNYRSFDRGEASALTSEQKTTVDAVMKFYGNKSPSWLSGLTHMEDPWKKARKGLPPDSYSDAEISLPSMELYYDRISKRN